MLGVLAQQSWVGDAQKRRVLLFDDDLMCGSGASLRAGILGTDLALRRCRSE